MCIEHVDINSVYVMLKTKNVKSVTRCRDSKSVKSGMDDSIKQSALSLHVESTDSMIKTGSQTCLPLGKECKTM